MNTRKIRLFSVLMCALGLVMYIMLGTAVAAHADEAQAESGTLNIVSRDDGTALSGIKWNIYRVGSHLATGEFVLEGDFADYPADFGDLSASAMQEAAQILEENAIADGLLPGWTASADENGELSVNGVAAGLYLLSGEIITIGDVTYDPAPAIIEVKANADGSYDLTVYPKFESTEVPPSSSQADSSSDVGSSSEESSSSTDTSSNSDVSSSTSSTSTSSGMTNSTSSGEKVPQTGQLWWPVPIFSALGIVLIGMGLRVCAKREHDNDE
ncbi:hypothetical protein [Ruminococcus sp. 210702-SL.1.03]|uniref:hypothetical protein n=1 Tax=Ruminococcus sp. 210702-SL.1.03 TaxID=2883233 RepID=UPI001D094139|nr:hypothetical protein [Ruminococcus sp. 210702-SL.1.03]MCB6615876.1 hypothetical protein [Ruminococcus sp. 210702-SL.1.03]